MKIRLTEEIIQNQRIVDADTIGEAISMVRDLPEDSVDYFKVIFYGQPGIFTISSSVLENV